MRRGSTRVCGRQPSPSVSSICGVVMKRKDISIIDYVTDPQLLGLSISEPQETLLRVIYGLRLSDHQRDIWMLYTGRQDYPPSMVLARSWPCAARDPARTRGSPVP